MRMRITLISFNVGLQEGWTHFQLMILAPLIIRGPFFFFRMKPSRTSWVFSRWLHNNSGWKVLRREERLHL
jgi:hypothetical protein